MDTMKAVRIHEYGGLDVMHYEDAPQPQPADDEVLIRVHAASVNPVEWKIREGEMQAMLPMKMPITLGCDLAGTIERAGANVKNLKAGDEVFGYVSLMKTGLTPNTRRRKNRKSRLSRSRLISCRRRGVRSAR